MSLELFLETLSGYYIKQFHQAHRERTHGVPRSVMLEVELLEATNSLMSLILGFSFLSAASFLFFFFVKALVLFGS